MKAIIAAVLLLLSGCIIPLPIGEIDRAINGTHCVQKTALPGEIITDGVSGQRLRIVEVNKTEDGTPYRGCGARLPNRAKVEAVTDEGQGLKIPPKDKI